MSRRPRPVAGLAARTRACAQRDGERGSVSVFFVVAVVALLVVVGLVVDGAGKVRALQRADAAAAEAARAGGQAIDGAEVVRGGAPQVDTAQAVGAAQSYLTAAGVTGSVQVDAGTRLQVMTSTSYTPVFLGIIGVGPQHVTGHAQARLVRGLRGQA